MLPDIHAFIQAKIPLTPLKGKRPVVKKWTKQRFKTADLEAILHKVNFGVVLQANHIVIDVDPRNFVSPDTWDNFIEIHNLNLTSVPSVKTGGGGFHFYFSKPENVNIIETIKGFDGIEFKSVNRQVVIPGCIHPDSGKYYEWIANRNNLQNLQPIPDSILLLITRPHTSAEAHSLLGAFSIEDIQKILDELDPIQYREHDDWLKIMMACHHASAGAARQEFINWSTSDPKYKNDDHIIGIRWDSLSYEAESKITYRTLRFELQKIGKADIMKSLYKNDEDLPPSITRDLGLIHSNDPEVSMGPFEYLNSRYCSVMAQNKVVLYHKMITDPHQWTHTTKHSFEDQHEGMTVELKGHSRPISLVKAWYKWRYQRRAHEAMLDIEGLHKDNTDVLNLWTGWAIRPNANTSLSWDYLELLLKHALAGGNDEYYEYILNWIAYMFQKPHIMPEVALVFTGSKGTGKSTLGSILAHIVGKSHAIHVSSPDVFVGRFNSHLENKIFIFADEAISPTNDAQHSRLKAYITEDSLVVEAKGLAAKQIRNYYHLIIASNDPKPVPITKDERRFAYFKVSDEYRNDVLFFKGLHKEMENGGYEKFLHDMLMRPLGDWAPRDNVPRTDLFIEQKHEDMPEIDDWWYQVLNGESTPPTNLSLNNELMSLESPSIHKVKELHDKMRWFNNNCWFFRDEVIYLYAKSKGKKVEHIPSKQFWPRLRTLTGIAKSNEYGAKKNKFIQTKYVGEDLLFEYTSSGILKELKNDGLKEPQSRATYFPSIEKCRKIMQHLYDGDLEFTDKETFLKPEE